jgi:hypothetical protein
MPCTTARTASPHPNFIDPKTRLAKLTGKFFIWSRRPNSEDASGAQRRPGGGESLEAIQFVIALASQSLWAIVDVK